MATRQEVYEALDTERTYQGKRWGDANHSITEFLVYMQDYVAEALHKCSRLPDEEANPQALDSIRKVAALGVAAMEQHGAPKRPAL